MSQTRDFKPLYIIIVLFSGILIGESHIVDMLLPQKKPGKQKLDQLIEIIDKEYFKTVNTDSILEGAVGQILKSLDPHSIYIPKSQGIAIKETIDGSFVGIGIQYRTIRDTVAVVRILKESPAQRYGLKAGDRILTVDKDTFFGKPKKTIRNIQNKIKGEKGSTLTLGVYRKYQHKQLSIKIKRGDIPLESIETAFMLNDSLGYLKISGFYKTTYTDFIKQLKSLKKAGAKALVLDLRNNPGGLLDVAVDIADEFLLKDKTIVIVKDKEGLKSTERATSGGIFENKPLYILINEGSASASEVLAGAIQDNDAGTVVGRRSFGKGLIQREMELADGSSVRITVGEYLTPTGRSIQRPYKMGDSESYRNDYQNRLEKPEPSPENKTDTLPQKAYKTPKGKSVYGGGGITPDVVVPTLQAPSYLQQIEHALMYDFVFDYLDDNRYKYNDLSENDFMKTIEVDQKITETFTAYLKTKTGIKTTPSSLDEGVSDRIKANIALQLYGNTAFSRLMISKDRDVLKAKQLLSEKAK